MEHQSENAKANDPKSDAPSLTFRILKRRHSRAIAQLAGRIGELSNKTTASELDALMDDIIGFLKDQVVGWDNQTDEQGKPLPFDPADLDRILSDTDLLELVQRLPMENMATAEERKKSVSQSRSSTARTASNAPPALNAGTPQATATPSKSSVQNAEETVATNAAAAAST